MPGTDRASPGNDPSCPAPTGHLKSIDNKNTYHEKN